MAVFDFIGDAATGSNLQAATVGAAAVFSIGNN